MFDLTSSKLLILAIVALLVVGPKDFPVLLRTIGRYMGILRKHATEFRSQFDEAIREAELDQMRDQVEQMSRDIEKSVREADAKLASEFDGVGRDADEALAIPEKRADRVVITEPSPASTNEEHGEPQLDAPAQTSLSVDAATPEQAPVHVPAPASPLPRAGALAGGQPGPVSSPATEPAPAAPAADSRSA